MAEFTLRENADRYLLGEITLDQLNKFVDEDIIEDFQYGERDSDETDFAGFLFGLHYDFDISKKAHGYFEEDEFRNAIAAHLYLKSLKTETAKAS